MARSEPNDSVFAIDLRGLALLRFGLGAMLILDLLNRLRSFAAHYGSNGVIPREVYFAEFEHKWHISLHLFTSSDGVTGLLFGLALVAAACLALGFKTRVATIASWLLLISLHSRNPFVLQGGDEILRALLFWAMFLPLGARYSVDRALAADHDQPPTQPAHSMATVCLIGQIVLLYAFATLSKLSHPVWWSEGLGVYYALGVEQFTTEFGLLLRGQTSLLRLLNYATLTLQAAAPLLLLLPGVRRQVRTWLPLTMAGLHLGFALSMELGLFSYIVIVMWLALLDRSVLDRIESRLPNLGPWIRTKGARLLQRNITANEKAKTNNSHDTFSSNPIYKAALATLLVYLFWWNLAGVDRELFRMPTELKPIGQVLRLEQRFKMFSNPPRYSQWFVVTGVAKDETEVDVQTGQPPSFTKPRLVSDTFATQRWRKYMNNIATTRGGAHRKHFARFTCGEWNAAHPGNPIARVRITQMRQATPAKPTLGRNPPDRVVLGTWNCPDSNAAP